MTYRALLGKWVQRAPEELRTLTCRFYSVQHFFQFYNKKWWPFSQRRIDARSLLRVATIQIVQKSLLGKARLDTVLMIDFWYDRSGSLHNFSRIATVQFGVCSPLAGHMEPPKGDELPSDATSWRSRRTLILLACVICIGIVVSLSVALRHRPSGNDEESPPHCSTRPPISPPLNSTSNSTGLAYVPGELSVTQHGLLLSTGLSARLLAQSGQLVQYDNAEPNASSAIPFHPFPDMGATFKDPRAGNEDGWIYVSNSEVFEPEGMAGVGALTFDSNGNLTDYRMILEGSTGNCGGGRTNWETWISCEEHDQGVIWQVDPTGVKTARPITLGSTDRGKFESFAYDDRYGHYFVTEDDDFGPLRRFTPSFRNLDDPREELHGDGETKFLRLIPNSDNEGTYEWIGDKEHAKLNAHAFYPNAEGIDVDGNRLYFISKELKTMFVLDLDGGTYTSHTTRSGVFDGEPDQLQRIVGVHDGLLYFTEDGGKYAGVHARNRLGQFFTILEGSRCEDETTGLAFSPDGVHLYVAFQEKGELFDVTRDDGMPFHFKTLNIKYHSNLN